MVQSSADKGAERISLNFRTCEYRALHGNILQPADSVFGMDNSPIRRSHTILSFNFEDEPVETRSRIEQNYHVLHAVLTGAATWE